MLPRSNIFGQTLAVSGLLFSCFLLHGAYADTNVVIPGVGDTQGVVEERPETGDTHEAVVVGAGGGGTEEIQQTAREIQENEIGDNRKAAGDTEGEPEEPRSLGDLSGQIIKEQDAEEGDWRYRQGQDARWPYTSDRSTLCPSPEPPTNGYLQGANFGNGGVVYIFCEQGFALHGPANITCVAIPHPNAVGGAWIPNEEYTCSRSYFDESYNEIEPEVAKISSDTSFHEEVYTSCEPPSPPENGFLRGDNLRLRGVVFVYCEAGYHLQGPSNITCLPISPAAPQDGGVWMPRDEYRCLRSQEVEVITLDTRPRNGPPYKVMNGQSNYVTDPRLKSKVARVRVSQQQQQLLTCDPPQVPDHGKVIGTDYSEQATILYECDAGYVLHGPNHATCLVVPDPFNHVAIWDPPTVPTCAVKSRMMPGATNPAENQEDTWIPHRRVVSQPNTNMIEGLESACALPKEVGPCREAIERFYFDTQDMECRPFTYGGCHGNENNFETMKECQFKCL